MHILQPVYRCKAVEAMGLEPTNLLTARSLGVNRSRAVWRVCPGQALCHPSAPGSGEARFGAVAQSFGDITTTRKDRTERERRR